MSNTRSDSSHRQQLSARPSETTLRSPSQPPSDPSLSAPSSASHHAKPHPLPPPI
eukprot:CAMPEP_0202418704 /NCGR_PEP_ID=MMETSP1128-20130828/47094_1 /ASSEMBLY_ACC=CAM_ASM_000463 /TAXON_ID=3047 /ORGANISM="Dunaliella tertiolecta, Strain CCMP1320" /LENGTH=54 /DNA_ID=CAMNT_0049026431 /DNA_START=53 /DNA_END=214 /DNA_ORIENTATION=+